MQDQDTPTTVTDDVVGREGIFDMTTLDGNTLHFPVRIIEVKRPFGILRYVITPTNGQGQATVNADRVSLNEE